jgi:proline dehydrogenase
MLSRALILKVASWGWVERLVRRSFLFRPLLKRFIAGESLEQAMAACQYLFDKGFLITLDYLGENV